MPVNFTPHTEADARKVSTRTLLKAGWCDVARIIEAVEKLAKSGKPMIELTVSVPDAEGNERQLRDWLLPTSNLGALNFFMYLRENNGELKSRLEGFLPGLSLGRFVTSYLAERPSVLLRVVATIVYAIGNVEPAVDVSSTGHPSRVR